MVFLDTSTVLEITLQNRARFQQVEKFLESVQDTTAISMLSVHLIMHFGRKVGVDDTFLQGIIEQNELLALKAEDYEWAKINEPNKDFEDALQVAVAIRNSCEAFVTIDRALAKAYGKRPINIITI